jgi:hypothetical protein
MLTNRKLTIVNGWHGSCKAGNRVGFEVEDAVKGASQ